jgi:hypothetical protein
MALQIITLLETMIVHKAVHGAISKQCIEWRNNANHGICFLLLNNTSMIITYPWKYGDDLTISFFDVMN